MTRPSETRDAAAVARGLSKAHRTCGDVLDRFPCARCGARVSRDCPIPMPERVAGRLLINDNPDAR